MERQFSCESIVVKGYYWAKIEENRTAAPFEHLSSSSEESASLEYNTPFMDHKEGEGIMIIPGWILRMRVERAELCWSNMKFEAKSQIDSIFASWTSKLMANPD